MEIGDYPGLAEVSVHQLREYILDLVHELATVAGRQGDSRSERALQTCWSEIRDEEQEDA
jgi:hypothetical protein